MLVKGNAISVQYCSPFSQEPSSSPTPNCRFPIGYDVPKSGKCQRDVCNKAAKTLSLLVLPPKEKKDV